MSGPGSSGRDVAHLDRRGFLRVLGVAGAGVALSPAALAQAHAEGNPYGVLVDTTQCIGCKKCTRVCAEGHGLPVPDESSTETSPEQLTAVEGYLTDDERVDAGAVFVKRQCLHCLQPACATACLTEAMHKTADGPVVWDEDKCMGCRYCMVSCPFGVPKFEYDSPMPEIRKCDLCIDRLAIGEPPRCVENCSAEALVFGRRKDLLAEAHRRIADDPDVYQHHIFGEREAGGTSWLYLSALPFDQIGFPKDLDTETYPSLTKEFLYGVPIVLTLVPPLLLGIGKAVRGQQLRLEEGTNHD